MSEPFIGEIKMFAGNYAPRNWAFCNGQLLAVSSNDALFSLLGTMYGGDGRTTFGLPDMRGRLPVHLGNGPGLTDRRIGAKGGIEQVTLTTNQIPAHSHQLTGASTRADKANPAGSVFAHQSSTGDQQFLNYADDTKVMAPSAIGYTGRGQNHNNMPPFQCINFIIALVGVYPSRS